MKFILKLLDKLNFSYRKRVFRYTKSHKPFIILKSSKKIQKVDDQEYYIYQIKSLVNVAFPNLEVSPGDLGGWVDLKTFRKSKNLHTYDEKYDDEFYYWISEGSVLIDTMLYGRSIIRKGVLIKNSTIYNSKIKASNSSSKGLIMNSTLEKTIIDTLKLNIVNSLVVNSVIRCRSFTSKHSNIGNLTREKVTIYIGNIQIMYSEITSGTTMQGVKSDDGVSSEDKDKINVNIDNSKILSRKVSIIANTSIKNSKIKSDSDSTKISESVIENSILHSEIHNDISDTYIYNQVIN